MFTCKTKTKDKIRTLVFNGVMNIYSADKLKSILSRAFNNVNGVIVSLEGVTEVDLSCLQVLYSAYVTSEIKKKTFVIERNPSSVFMKLVEDSGYACHKRQAICLENINGLWVEERKDA